MVAKSAPERIAVIDERNARADRVDMLGDGIRDALANAGFDVARTHDADVEDEVDFIVRVAHSRRTRSGILRSTVADVENATAAKAKAADAASAASELEEQLRQTQRMESIAVLAGGIAHDFNNILSVISICADEAMDLSGDDVSRTCLTEIRRAVDRGAMLTRDLLSFSRRDVPEPRTVDFNEVVADTQRMLERLVGDDVKLVMSLAALDSCVRIDPNQWSGVLVNLALNARQAMPDGGSLTIRTRDLLLDPGTRGREKAHRHYVELEVTDTGCGIPEEVQGKIFEPFFTTRGVGKGTGLGLSVVYGVVEQSGGWIDVESSADKGSTFRVYIPSVASPRSRSTDAPVSTSRPSTKTKARILLVEDEETVRRLAHRMLEREGFVVTAVGSAEKAILAAESGVDILVTDVVLPGMDGRDLADALAARAPQMLVLYTSGYSEGTLPVDVAERSFLQKPYTAKLLVHRIEEMLGVHRRR